MWPPSIESTICRELNLHGSCTFKELVKLLPDYSWSQVFAAVDRLSRDGTLTLRHPTQFDYLVSVTPRPSGADQNPTKGDEGALVLYRLTGS